MRKLLFTFVAFVTASFLFMGCNGRSGNTTTSNENSMSHDSIADSTIYGVCGESTAMHTLELISDLGDTLHYVIGENAGGKQDVKGGLLVGDRLAVIEGGRLDGYKVAKQVLNLTTLMGRWVSADKDFEIREGGTVKSLNKMDDSPWTSWKIRNGQLLLNADTFDVYMLNADSLFLENSRGIFAFKKQQ